MIISKLKELRAANKVTEKQLAVACGMTVNGLRSIISRNDIKLSTLTKIAEYFNVPITYFFDENSPVTNNVVHNNNGSNYIHGNVSGDGNNLNIGQNDCKKELLHLKEILAMKEEMIDMQRTLIKTLQKSAK